MSVKSPDECLIDILVEGFQNVEHERAANVFTPSMDIYEAKKGLVFELELPDVAKEDIKIVIENNRLLIRGWKKFYKASKNVKFHLLERPFGHFEKIFEIPANANIEKISAALNDGILKIFIPARSDRTVAISRGNDIH